MHGVRTVVEPAGHDCEGSMKHLWAAKLALFAAFMVWTLSYAMEYFGWQIYIAGASALVIYRTHLRVREGL